MKLRLRVIMMLSGISALLACQHTNELNDWLQDPNRINPKEAQILKQWLLDNELDANLFVVTESPANNSEEYSVMVNQGLIQSIKANGINKLSLLSKLSALHELNLAQVGFRSLLNCPATLQKLRLMGSALETLDGVESCVQLNSIKVVHTQIRDLSPLMKLPELKKAELNFNPLTEVVITSSAPKLKWLNLQKNNIQNFTLQAIQPELEKLFLDKNMLGTLTLNSHTPKLVVLTMNNNLINDLNSIPIIKSLNSISLHENPIKDLTPLKAWPKLSSIKFKGVDQVPKELAGKIDQQLNATDKQRLEAQKLKAQFLASNMFIEELPDMGSGQVKDLTKQINSHFSLNGSSGATGSIQAAQIKGMIKLSITQSKDLKYQYKSIDIKGTATLDQGELSIYSPVNINFWNQAALFVDRPVKSEPKDIKEMKIKGYLVKVIKAGEKGRFKSTLIPFSDRYYLLLAATSGDAQGVKLILE